jgi:drug/metabolite transporter (DMT)-like permease
MIAQAVLTALALVRRRGWRLVAGAGLALLGALYLVGGLGEPLDPVASDPNVVVYALLRITGLLGAIALVAAGAATVIASLRGS